MVEPLRLEISTDTTGAVKNVRVLNQEFTKFQKTATDTGKKAEDAGEKLDGFGKSALSVAAGLAAVWAGSKFIDFMKAGATEAAEAADSISRLGFALESSEEPFNQTLQDLDAFAGSMQDVTAFSDDAVRSVQAILLQTGTSEAVFTRATKAILDTSEALGIDLNTAAQKVGLALQDPEKGLRSLREMNIVFTKSQRETIQALIETGDAAGAQEMILSSLEKKYQGAAESMASSFGGMKRQIENAIAEINEAFGKGLLGAGDTGFMDEILSQLKDPELLAAIQSVGKTIGEIFSTGISVAADFLKLIIQFKDELFVLGSAAAAAWSVTKIVEAWEWMKKLHAQFLAIDAALSSQKYMNFFSGIQTGMKTATTEAAFFSTQMRSSFLAVSAIAGTVATSIAVVFSQAMQSVIDSLDREIERIKTEADRSKEAVYALRTIAKEGTEEEKRFVQELNNSIAAGTRGNAALREELVKAFYEGNQKMIDATLRRIEAEKRAGQEIQSIQEEGTKAEIDAIERIVQREKEKGTTLQTIAKLVKAEKDRQYKAEQDALKETEEAIKKAYEERMSMLSKLNIATQKSNEESNRNIATILGVWRDFSDEIQGSSEKMKAFGDETSRAIEYFVRTGKSIPQWILDINGAMLEATTTAGLLSIENTNIERTFADLAVTVKDVDSEYIELIDSQEESRESFHDSNDIIKANAKTLEKFQDGLKDVNVDFGDIVDSIGSLMDALVEMGAISSKTAGALKGLFSGIVSIAQSVQNIRKISQPFSEVQSAIDKMSAAMKTASAAEAPALKAKIEALQGVLESEKVPFITKLATGIQGAIGIATTAFSVISSIVKLFEKDWTGDAIKALEGLPGITKAVIEQVASDAAELGNITLAVAKNFEAIVQAAGNMSKIDFSKLTAEIVELYDKLEKRETGLFSSLFGRGEKAAKAQKELIAAFDDLTDRAEDLGIVADVNLVKFIKMIEEEAAKTGEKIFEIWSYVNDQLKNSAEGFETYLSAFKDVSEIEEEIQKTKDSYVKGIDDLRATLEKKKIKLSAPGISKEQRDKLLKEIDEIQREIDIKTAEAISGIAGDTELQKKIKELEAARGDISKSWAFIQGEALNQIGLLQQQGFSVTEILQKFMGDDLKMIADMAKDNGLEINAALKQALDLAQFTSDFPDITNQIKGLQSMITGMANTGKLNVDNIKGYGAELNVQFQNAVDSGLSMENALAMMGPSLKILKDYAKNFNIELDPVTKNLIEQADNLGMMGQTFEPQEKILKDGFGAITDSIRDLNEIGLKPMTDAINNLVRTLGGEIPGATETASGAMLKYTQKMILEFDTLGLSATNAADEIETSMTDAAGTVKVLSNASALARESFIDDFDLMADAVSGVGKEIRGIGKDIEGLPNLKGEFGDGVNKGFRVEKFATGGVVTAPGYGARDTLDFWAKVSPGEQITFTPREQAKRQQPMIQKKDINITLTGSAMTESDWQFAQRIIRIYRDNTAGIQGVI